MWDINLLSIFTELIIKPSFSIVRILIKTINAKLETLFRILFLQTPKFFRVSGGLIEPDQYMLIIDLYCTTIFFNRRYNTIMDDLRKIIIMSSCNSISISLVEFMWYNFYCHLVSVWLWVRGKWDNISIESSVVVSSTGEINDLHSVKE